MAMLFSQLFTRRPMSGKPYIERIFPRAAIAGGEIQIQGNGFCTDGHRRPQVKFGGLEASLLVSSDHYLVARVPEGAVSCDVTVTVDTDHQRSNPYPMEIGVAIADNLHPVANPAMDRTGNIFVTFS